jgi:hypothetical protein
MAWRDQRQYAEIILGEGAKHTVRKEHMGTEGNTYGETTEKERKVKH